MPEPNHKVPHPYSGAGNSAPSLDGVRDDGLSIKMCLIVSSCGIGLKRKHAGCSYDSIRYADGMFAKFFAHFVNGEHSSTDIDIIDFCLIERIQSAVLLPDKLYVAVAEMAIDDEVDGVSQIPEDRHQPFRRCLFHTGLSRSTVHDADKLLRRQTEGVAHDACNPFIERVLEHGVAGELEIAALGNKCDATTPSGIAGQRAVNHS